MLNDMLIQFAFMIISDVSELVGSVRSVDHAHAAGIGTLVQPNPELVV